MVVIAPPDSTTAVRLTLASSLRVDPVGGYSRTCCFTKGCVEQVNLVHEGPEPSRNSVHVYFAGAGVRGNVRFLTPPVHSTNGAQRRASPSI